MQYEYILLAPGFAREVVEVYDAWESKGNAPMRIQELMLVLRIEVSKLYRDDARRAESAKPRVPRFKDTKFSRSGST